MYMRQTATKHGRARKKGRANKRKDFAREHECQLSAEEHRDLGDAQGEDALKVCKTAHSLPKQTFCKQAY